MNCGFSVLIAVSIAFGTSLNAYAGTTPPAPPPPPVLRFPVLNLGCAPGMMAQCGCDYFTCQDANGQQGGGYPAPMKVCGDVNGEGGPNADIQDCIDATKQICQLQGYATVYSYDCYDYPEPSGYGIGEPAVF